MVRVVRCDARERAFFDYDMKLLLKHEPNPRYVSKFIAKQENPKGLFYHYWIVNGKA